MNPESSTGSGRQAATHMQTPCGPMRIPEWNRKQLAAMTDEEVRKQALDNGTSHIDPFAFSEMLHRGLRP